MKQVILLHGLHMHSWAMQPMAYFLRQHDCDVRTFDYYSVMQTPPQHSAALYRVINQWQQDTGRAVHLVGHSLGGLVLRHFVAEHGQFAGGRLVTLGTPHQGSSAAKCVNAWGALAVPLLGGAYANALDGHVPRLPEAIELGSLAGNCAQGMGWFIGLSGANDGTVTVAETECEGQRDHIILPVSHTGMLLNHEVARQTAFFLEHARFDH